VATSNLKKELKAMAPHCKHFSHNDFGMVGLILGGRLMSLMLWVNILIQWKNVEIPT